MSRAQLRAFPIVMGLLVVTFFAVSLFAVTTVTAQTAPASQVAPASPSLDDPMALAQALMQAFGNQSWPLVVMLVLGLLLFVERHFRGVLGQRSSDWLGSPKGIALTSLVTAVVTAGLSAATGGWAALGKGCLVALVVGLLNLGLQWPKASPPAAP